MPPDLQDWLAEDHLARFVGEVIDTLNLDAIMQVYAKPSRGGPPAYHPRLMLRLIIYGYTVAVCSSRRIEQATFERIDFRVLAADQHPDHDSIAAFRKLHLRAIADLFLQVLLICHQAGMVKLDHVALDGTKLMANAAKGNTRSAKSLLAEEKKLQQEIQERLRQQVGRALEEADRIDAEEDALYGSGETGAKMPEELHDPKKRLAFIQEAVANLRQQAKEQAEQEAADGQRKADEHEAQKKRGRKPAVPDAAQIELELLDSHKLRTNLTDPESRLMRDGATKAILQGYNAQAVVDTRFQIIVAADVTDEANDKQQLVAMGVQVERNLGVKPRQLSADTGYFSEAQVTDERLAGIDLLVPPDRACTQSSTDPEACRKLDPESTGSLVWYNEPPTPSQTMRAKLTTPQGRDAYRLRGMTVEPVFGQIKEGRGLRRFLLRGLSHVQDEWRLMCLGHNLLKLYRNRASLDHRTNLTDHKTARCAFAAPERPMRRRQTAVQLAFA